MRRPSASYDTHWTAWSHSSAASPYDSRSANCHASTQASVGTRRRMKRAHALQNAQSPSYTKMARVAVLT